MNNNKVFERVQKTGLKSAQGQETKADFFLLKNHFFSLKSVFLRIFEISFEGIKQSAKNIWFVSNLLCLQFSINYFFLQKTPATEGVK